MKTIELATRAVLQTLLAVCAAFLCVKLCTGCAVLEKVNAKGKVVEGLRTAYADGGATAVSNRIEKLVTDGSITRGQADRLHVLAQSAYAKLLDHVESELSDD